MNDNIQRALDALLAIPPDWENVDAIFLENNFTEEELARIAAECVNECFLEYHDALDPDVHSITLENMSSTHLIERLQFLLNRGLNPNTCSNDENAMWVLQYTDYPNLAGNALKLLLENGGNPNFISPDCSETLLEYASFSLEEDDFDRRYFHRFQHLLVLIAYGACWRDGTCPVRMLNGNSVEILKDFERFDFVRETVREGSDWYYQVHIFDKETKEDVAIYKG